MLVLLTDNKSMRSLFSFVFLPKKWIAPFVVVAGIIAGMGSYIIYMSNAHVYLTDNPAACVNCHVMTPYYQTWFHSSHAQWTSCGDCHVPQQNLFRKFSAKAIDGFLHTAVFTMRTEPLAIRSRPASSNTIMDNCIRCHSQLNTEFVNTGMISFTQAREGMGKACWDCHSNVPHGKLSSIASTPDAIVTPLPDSPIPAWLKRVLENRE